MYAGGFASRSSHETLHITQTQDTHSGTFTHRYILKAVHIHLNLKNRLSAVTCTEPYIVTVVRGSCWRLSHASRRKLIFCDLDQHFKHGCINIYIYIYIYSVNLYIVNLYIHTPATTHFTKHMAIHSECTACSDQNICIYECMNLMLYTHRQGDISFAFAMCLTLI